jgi:hypothetical protein
MKIATADHALLTAGWLGTFYQARIEIRVTQIGRWPATFEMNTNPPQKRDTVIYEGF